MSLHDALEGLEYPCDYPFKLICVPNAVEDVRSQILNSLGAQARIIDVHQRASRNGKYVALTVIAEVSNAAQVEIVYDELKAVQGIVTSL